MFRGHFWTLGPHFRALLRPPVPPTSQHFRVAVSDPALGDIRLTGRLSTPTGADTLLLLVHGLGGGAGRAYMVRAAAAAHARGVGTLRLNLRGADRCGEDFYHAGLTADLHATLASPELAGFSRIFVMGFSLGGHVTLRLMTELHDSRIVAVAAVCPPLDLAKSANAMDRPARRFYRVHVLSGLKEMYTEVFARRGGPAPLRDALAIDTLRGWDEHIIAPRHGFEGAEDYWAKMMVAGRLHTLRKPALVVVAEGDPMILLDTVRPVLEGADGVDARWVPPERGGHVGFPDDLDLGVDAPLGLESQVLGWLVRN